MKIEEICEDNFIKKVNIMIAAAGTGGHINPGIAIAEYLQKNGYKISWLGTPKGMENKLINKTKFQFTPLSISGVRNKGLIKMIKLPFILMISTIQAIKALWLSKAKLLIVMGGYVSVPAALAAKVLNIKLIVHEQNAIPGLTNKVLSYISDINYSAFTNSLKGSQIIGNPIRKEVQKISGPKKRFLNRKGPLRVLVFGGSLGAKVFNQHLPPVFKKINEKNKISVIHQSGENMFDLLDQAYKNAKFKVEIKKYIFDMDKKYSWADIVIARSGALTVSEMIQSGTASILIPYPFAVDDHQYFNAKILEDVGAAYIIREKDLEKKLMDFLTKLDRKKCKNMAMNAKQLQRYDSCNEILKACTSLIK
ncbi:MAG: undecaprenyldiphospho-muramoylpentapeptide beta-N-acetylglucosaminyltransferase [Nitrosomonadales bacterium]|nr:undecaprenyldiphospho-muramoylpentapeptide beta-N-acetylglucosaminyltransferase [Nitrosomonadales bacterium]MBT4759226.1 undecaprenyldiphospho-muramoylpentapeptide beta-N-acetylglucosaminyltransferase [Nitrosomonadales bacterium]